MQKVIFYIKAFFLVIHYLLKKGYEPDWLYTFDPTADRIGNRVEYSIATGGSVESFAENIVEDLQLALYFKNYKFGETIEFRDLFYDNYKEQKMLNRKH